MIPDTPWLLWAIIALLCGLAEMQVPGAYLIWIAISAAFMAALTAILRLPMEAQIVIFAIASLASCYGGFHVYRRGSRWSKAEGTLNQRNLAMLGARGVVSVALSHGRGKVRLGDSDWLAEGPDLDAGTAVVVTSVRGTVVIVTPLPEKQPA